MLFGDSSSLLLPAARPSARFPRLVQFGVTSCFFLLAALALTALISSFLSLPLLAWHSDLPSTPRPAAAFTRDVHPVPIHSHNDYWRPTPLFSALAAGAISIEADVWLFPGASSAGGDLFVGHAPSSLSRSRTFNALYIAPLLQLLRAQNPRTEFTSSSPEQRLNGVFDVDPMQTLHLFVDFKTSSAETLRAVLAHLAPLRAPTNYLTHTTGDGGGITHGPVTVHFTGAVPPLASGNDTAAYRDYFLDAPLHALGGGSGGEHAHTHGLSLFASGPLPRPISAPALRAQIADAHDRGMMVRYWDTPAWPIGLRNQVWGVLVELGVDLLNVDDLEAASSLKW